jgi:hypothetical protein
VYILGPGGHGRREIRVGQGKASLGLGSMLDSVNWPYLRRTVVIEAAVMVAVVIIDASRRRLRSRRRARQRPAGWALPRSSSG